MNRGSRPGAVYYNNDHQCIFTFKSESIAGRFFNKNYKKAEICLTHAGCEVLFWTNNKQIFNIGVETMKKNPNVKVSF